MRSVFVAFAAFIALGLGIGLTSSGCGGGGTTGGPGGSTGTLDLAPSSATVGPNGRVQLLARSNFLAVDVTWSSTAGVITPTGIGTAVFDSPSSGSAVITATRVGGTGTDTSTVSISPGTATVTGRIVDSVSFNGIEGAIIDFYNGSSVVASVSAIPNGYFSAAVPLTATRFHVRSSSISTGFYKQYSYDTKRYSMLISNCTAPLPALSAGTNVPLVTSIVVNPSSGPPPPPPTGCP